MRGLWVVGLLAGLYAGAAQADFNGWSVESTEDPFSGGSKIEISYISSLRSGAFVICDTSRQGLEVRVLAGFEYVTDLDGYNAEGKFAFDGELALSVSGTPTAFGQNIAGVSFQLSHGEGQLFAGGMKSARKQVAIQDGISNSAHLLKVRGSTKAGEVLEACLAKQGDTSRTVAPVPSEEGESAAVSLRSSEDVARYAMFIATVLATEVKCEGYSAKSAVKLDSELTADQKLVLSGILNDERARILEDVSKMSCPAAAAEAMKYTDLSYDSVWKAR